jgi:hypothetical protein
VVQENDMRKLLYRTTQGVLFCCLAAALPALSQDSQQQPDKHPAQEKQTQKTQHKGQKPAKAHPSARPSAKPAPAEHNAGRPQAENRNARPGSANNNARQPNRQTNQGARPAANHHVQAQPASGRANQGHANHGARPAQWGHPPAHRGSYQFRSNDRQSLHRYYQSRIGSIDRGNRPVFTVGGYFPYEDIDGISPLPPDIYGSLPPPPPGYQMGYYDGYIVVYDPETFYIAAVIDLLQ